MLRDRHLLLCRWLLAGPAKQGLTLVDRCEHTTPSGRLQSANIRVKLQDFGLAKDVRFLSTVQSRVGPSLGSPACMSCEQCSGEGVDRPSGTHQTVNPLGLALSPSLHHRFCRYAVWSEWFEPCFAVTLITTAHAAAVVSSAHACARTITRTRGASTSANALTSVANTFWHLVTVSETSIMTAAPLLGAYSCIAACAAHPHRAHL